MKKQKMKLSALKVTSFVTALEDQENATVKGQGWQIISQGGPCKTVQIQQCLVPISKNVVCQFTKDRNICYPIPTDWPSLPQF